MRLPSQYLRDDPNFKELIKEDLYYLPAWTSTRSLESLVGEAVENFVQKVNVATASPLGIETIAASVRSMEALREVRCVLSSPAVEVALLRLRKYTVDRTADDCYTITPKTQRRSQRTHRGGSHAAAGCPEPLSSVANQLRNNAHNAVSKAHRISIAATELEKAAWRLDY